MPSVPGLKRETWRPTSSWTPSGSSSSASSSANPPPPASSSSTRAPQPSGGSSYHPEADSRNRDDRGRGWRNGGGGGGKDKDEGRSWSSYNDHQRRGNDRGWSSLKDRDRDRVRDRVRGRRADDDRWRDDDRRGGGGSGSGTGGGGGGKKTMMASDSYRPGEASTGGVAGGAAGGGGGRGRRESPDYGVGGASGRGRKDSPDYGTGPTKSRLKSWSRERERDFDRPFRDRDDVRSSPRRGRSPSPPPLRRRRSPSPLPSDRHRDRKRPLPPLSPRRSPPKRLRDLSPAARSTTSSRRYRSPSSPSRRSTSRSPGRYSVNGRSPTPPPRKSNGARRYSTSPPPSRSQVSPAATDKGRSHFEVSRVEAPREADNAAPSVTEPLHGGSPIKIDLGKARSSSPTKGGWKTIAIPPPQRSAAVQHMFDDSTPPGTAIPRRTSPPHPHPRNVDVDVDMDMDRPRARSQTIAPYIQGAFSAWHAQDAAPALHQFLVHYLGRTPTADEMDQVDTLMRVRHEVQERERDRRREDHWPPPPRESERGRDWVGGRDRDRDAGGKRRTWKDHHDRPGRSTSPTKANAIPIPQGASRFKGPVASEPVAQPPAPAPSPPPRASPTLLASAPISPPRPTVPTPPPHAHPKRPAVIDGETYERLACVGEGTYGKVYKARHLVSGVFVALKRIRMEGEKDGFPVTAMREIKLLQGLRHPNVLRLMEMMVSKGSVYMVFEYMHHDLTGLLAHPTITFSPANLKSLAHQMLAGLSYLHHSGILHRDMKGSNILLNAEGVLKLADFGLARVYNKRRRADYTNRVITLWYRGPELLMGETSYGAEVDMWSAGCIFLELFTTRPVFQGNDEIHQLEVIYGILGTPDEQSWPGVKDLPWWELVRPKEKKASKFREMFTKWLSPAGLDLAEGLLTFDPSKRLSADEAMAAAYFVDEQPAMERPDQLADCGEHHEMSAKQERHRRRQELESEAKRPN